jgi:hypothetical protein
MTHLGAWLRRVCWLRRDDDPWDLEFWSRAPQSWETGGDPVKTKKPAKMPPPFLPKKGKGKAAAKGKGEPDADD